MLTNYIQAAMRHARYRIFEDDNSYYGEIPVTPGVWANEATLEDCRTELQSALEDWVVFSLVRGFPMPVIDGIDLNITGAIPEAA